MKIQFTQASLPYALHKRFVIGVLILYISKRPLLCRIRQMFYGSLYFEVQSLLHLLLNQKTFLLTLNILSIYLVRFEILSFRLKQFLFMQASDRGYFKFLDFLIAYFIYFHINVHFVDFYSILLI